MSVSLTLTVGAEFCIPQAAQIQAEWLQQLAALEPGQPCEAVLELAGVEAMDSAGVQLLLALKAQLEQHGGQLQLVQPSRSVQDALGTFGLAADLRPVTRGAGAAA